MKSDLFALAYVSRRNAFEGGISLEGTVRSILATSRRNNSLHGVTGALMVSYVNYAQILEGTRAAVETIFSKIQADSRHRDIRMLYFKRIPRRDFPDWRMAMAGISNHPTLSVDAAFEDPYGIGASKIRTHLVTVLKTLVEGQEAGLLPYSNIPLKFWENVPDAR